MSDSLIFALACAAAAILYGVISIKWILGKPAGHGRVRKIAAAIQEAAIAYLSRQYRTIAIVGAVLFVLIYYFLGAPTAIGFLIGAGLSGPPGGIGLNTSVRAA